MGNWRDDVLRNYTEVFAPCAHASTAACDRFSGLSPRVVPFDDFSGESHIDGRHAVGWLDENKFIQCHTYLSRAYRTSFEFF